MSEAVRMFLQDEEARGLEHSSRKKSRTLFERQFLPFCEARKFTQVDRLLPIELTEFRSTWHNGDVTTHRKHEHMLDQVSIVLGHSGVKITERHYTPFCKARQKQLAASVKLAWKKPSMPGSSLSLAGQECQLRTA